MMTFHPRFALAAALLLLLPLAASPAAAQGAGAMKAKACETNLHTVEGAVEMFLMDESGSAAPGLTLQTLREKGYLRAVPQCPAGGVYTLRVSGGDGAPTVAVECSLHGRAGEIREAAPAEETGATEPAGTGKDPEMTPAQKEDLLGILDGKKPVYESDEGRAKGCAANLRSLAGAGELYAMEYPVDPPVKLTPAELKAKGYLLSDLECPAGGQYTVEVAKGKSVATCTTHGEIEK